LANLATQDYPARSEGQANVEDVKRATTERELWEWLDSLTDHADRVRVEEAKFEQFDRYMDMYYGHHWPETMPSFRPPVVVNELRTLILNEASDLIDATPRIYVMRDPTNGQRDEDVERALRAIWVREEVDLKVMNAICWALILGTGFLRVQWDPDAANGLGDVIVNDVDPRFVLPDPDAVDDHKWAYVIVESFTDISEVRRLFPVSGMKVKPEDKWSIRDKRRDVPGTVGSAGFYSGPMSNQASLLGKELEGFKKARARVLDCVIRDDRTDIKVTEVKGPDGKEVLDEGGKPKLEIKEVPLYPNGRRIVGANGVILFDGDNPNPGGDFGIIRVILEPTLNKFWGEGFVSQTMELQLAADSLMSGVVENAKRLNNGIVKATTNTGVDWESFAGMPGQIVQINQGSDFDIMYPHPMPPDMIQAPWQALDMQRRLLGFPQARAGESGRGNVSPELTETEITQAQGVTRLRSRMMYFIIKRLAEMIFARMASGYMTPRVIPAVEGERFKPVRWQPMERPERYSLYIDPTSFQVMSRSMLKRFGLALYKLGAIDRLALLEAVGWPNWEEVAQRMQQAQSGQPKPKVSVSLKGEVDKYVATDLAEGVDPRPHDMQRRQQSQQMQSTMMSGGGPGAVMPGGGPGI